MVRSNYEPNHPCFRCPPTPDGPLRGRPQHVINGACSPIPCQQGYYWDIEAQECVEDVEANREQEAASFWDGMDVPDFSVDDSNLPYPQMQFDHSTYQHQPPGESLSAHTVTRDKLMISRGSSYNLWNGWQRLPRADSLASTYFSHSPFQPDPGWLPTRNGRIYGLPGLAKLYNTYREDTQTIAMEESRPDPLRWMTGRVWAYTPNVYINSYEEIHSDRWGHVFRDPGIEGNIAGMRTRDSFSGAWFEEWDLLFDLERALYGEYEFQRKPRGAVASYHFTNPTRYNDIAQGITTPAEHRGSKNLRYLEGFGTVLEEEFWISFNSEMVFDSGNPTSVQRRKEIIKALINGYTHVSRPSDDPALRDDRTEALNFLFSGPNLNDVGNQYVDLSHRVKMPFFGEETENIAFTSKLSAEVNLLSNFSSQEFMQSKGRYKEGERSLPCPYRMFRQKSNPHPGGVDPDCESGAYNDSVKKFTSNNISQHFEEVHNTYKRAFPMVTEIKFETVQSNNVANLFRDYGMDKYLLDVWDKPQSKKNEYDPVRDLVSTGDTRPWQVSPGITFPQGESAWKSDVEVHWRSDYGIKSTNYFTEFLEQKAIFRNAGAGTHYRDNNYWTGNDDAIVKNERYNFSREVPITTAGNLFDHLAKEGILASFDETKFPLGVFPSNNNFDEDSEWSIALAGLNRDVLRAKINSLAWENYSDVPPEGPGPHEDDVLPGVFFERKKYFRTFEDVVNGHLAYSEPIGYVVRKYDITDGTPGIYKQSFYFSDSSDITEIKFLDSQIKYNRTYRYYINAINFVIGNKYTYKVAGTQRANDRVMDFADEFLMDSRNLEEAMGGTPEQRQQLLAEIEERMEGDWFQSDDTNHYASLKLIARSLPLMSIMEVPYFRKDVVTLDNPPLPPQVDIVPYAGIKDRVLINLSPSGGTQLLEPIAIFNSGRPDDDVGVANRMRRNQGSDLLPANHPRFNRVLFSGDSLPDRYEIVVLSGPSRPPTGYSDFASGKIYSYNAVSGNLHHDFKLSVNTDYYIFFRASDTAGRSNPSEVYYLQLVDYADGMFLVMEEYGFPTALTKRTATINSSIQIKPTSRQMLSNPRVPMIANRTPPPQRHVRGRLYEDVGVWEKQYRLRIKSKKTLRTVDVDFTFKTILHDHERPRWPRPPEAPISVDMCSSEWAAWQSTIGTPDIPEISPMQQDQISGPDCLNEADHLWVNFNLSNPPSWDPQIHRNLNELGQCPPNLIATMANLRNTYRPRSLLRPDGTFSDCACPPGTVLISQEISRINDSLDRNGFAPLPDSFADLNGCIPSNSLCDFPKIPHLSINQDTGQMEIWCECVNTYEPCGSDCLPPCEPGFTRDEEGCGCIQNCPPEGGRVFGRDPNSTADHDICYCPDKVDANGCALVTWWDEHHGTCVTYGIKRNPLCGPYGHGPASWDPPPTPTPPAPPVPGSDSAEMELPEGVDLDTYLLADEVLTMTEMDGEVIPPVMPPETVQDHVERHHDAASGALDKLNTTSVAGKLPVDPVSGNAETVLDLEMDNEATTQTLQTGAVDVDVNMSTRVPGSGPDYL